MASVNEPKTLIETAYLTKGVIGNVGMPGAPIAHFSLVVSPEEKTVSGIVEITQGIDAPSIKLNVVGDIRYAEYGDIIKIVSLKGEYTISVPPPGIGSYLEKFSAYLDVNKKWNGIGGFTFGFQKIEDVPVTSA